MARERAKLSDKQERILVQCQLMGLTPSDMTQISNRLVALEKERGFKADIADAMADKTWTKTNNGWTIVDSKGRTYECQKAKPGKRHQSYWDRAVYAWDVSISGPDKRYKAKTLSDVTVHIDFGITARICPENSKELYALLKGIKNGRIQ
jgi:hypothetical protein